MARTSGNNGVVDFDGGNVLLAVRSVSLPDQGAEVDVTAMGDANRQTVAGLSGGTGSITVVWDEADTTGQQAMEAAVRDGTAYAFIWYPKGNTTGLPQRSFSAEIGGVDEAQEIDNALLRTFSLNLRTDITRGLVP